MPVEIGEHLTIADVVRVARERAEVALSPHARERVARSRAMVLIEPQDKTDARKNLETEGLLASQAILAQLTSIRTVAAKIMYKYITLATVVGKRGEKGVTSTYHASLQ